MSRKLIFDWGVTTSLHKRDRKKPRRSGAVALNLTPKRVQSFGFGILSPCSFTIVFTITNTRSTALLASTVSRASTINARVVASSFGFFAISVAPCIVLRISVQSHNVMRLSIRVQYMTETKNAIVQLRIRPSLKEAAERAATDDQRSLTSLIEKLLADFLKKNGYLPK